MSIFELSGLSKPQFLFASGSYTKHTHQLRKFLDAQRGVVAIIFFAQRDFCYPVYEGVSSEFFHLKKLLGTNSSALISIKLIEYSY
mmetsp:Transcript_9394/g.31437  ORF Transcript_9394/g.31437 Transcript_9394/m.31437 type:complete len:86 (-) Transcript_9394:243-500(-)